MGGPIVRTGTTPEFWKNWDRVFGDNKKATKKKTTKSKTAVKASKKIRLRRPRKRPKKRSKPSRASRIQAPCM